jgi:hypothetical protein
VHLTPTEIISFGSLALTCFVAYVTTKNKVAIYLLVAIGLLTLVVSFFPQAERPSTTQKQSATAPGGSINQNQAGRDLTVNNGISEAAMSALLRDKSIAANKDLSQKYPYGYILLGAVNGKVIYEPNSRQFQVRADWENWQLSVDNGVANLFISTIEIVDRLGGVREIQHHQVVCPYREGQSAGTGLAAAKGIGIYFEVVDTSKQIFLIGFK